MLRGRAGLRSLGGVREVFDLVHFLVSPRTFLERHIVCLHRKRSEVLLVGSMHALHFGRGRLGMRTFDRLIDAYRPGRIALEIRPEDLKRGLVGLAPIDMVYLYYVAESRGLAVLPFDHWEEAVYRARVTGDGPEDFNSPERNERMSRLLEAGLGEGRTLAFMGYAHVHPIARHLSLLGFVPGGLDSDVRRPSLEASAGPRKVPAAVVPWLERSSDELTLYLRDHTERTAWTRRIRRKRDLLRKFASEAQRHDRRRAEPGKVDGKS